MERLIIKKENGEVRLINADMELIHSIKAGYTNPCFTCTKGNAIDCPKIADEVKHIEKYDFITDGYQINNINGELENLIVNACSNYKEQKERPRAKTKEELARLKHLKESLKILYFGGVDIYEADQTQHDLMRRGAIKEYDPRIKVHK